MRYPVEPKPRRDAAKHPVLANLRAEAAALHFRVAAQADSDRSAEPESDIWRRIAATPWGEDAGDHNYNTDDPHRQAHTGSPDSEDLIGRNTCSVHRENLYAGVTSSGIWLVVAGVVTREIRLWALGPSSGA